MSLYGVRKTIELVRESKKHYLLMLEKQTNLRKIDILKYNINECDNVLDALYKQLLFDNNYKSVI